MKKKFYFATLVIAALSFTGCANDEYVGDQRNPGEQNGAIAFSTKSTNTVRANSEVPTAAGKLNKQFWVYGWKTNSPSGISKVFDNYKVMYQGGASSSNTKGWEYVGIETNQTIKYWDYSASQYDFEAYSIKGTEGTGSVTRNTNAMGEYTVDGINQEGCASLYFADKTTVLKSEDPDIEKYGDVVTLTFKSVLSKIRVGFYETIPGYSVKITKFYGPTDTETGTVWATDGDDQKFVAWCPNKKIDDNNNNKSFVVSYNGTTPAVTKVKNINNNDEYQPISNNGYILNQSLTLGDNLLKDNTTIGESSSKVTWDNIDGESNPIYTYFIPQNDNALWNNTEANSKVKSMRIKVDYTLTSTDGSGEVINVTGATAIVPAEYLRWKPNTAYSYVFKISDNTNGSTGNPGDDPAGLYPIIFDAVVQDYANEGFITTVSTPSVTAKQDGTTAGYVTPEGIVFKTGTAIDLKVMNGDTEFNEPKITGDYIITDAYDYNKTPDQNLTAHSKDITTEQSTHLTVQDNSAGYWVLKVATSSDSRAAFTYVIIRVGSAEEGPANRPANS